MRPPMPRAEWRHDDVRGGAMPAPRPARRTGGARGAPRDDLRRLLGDLATLVAGVTVATRELGRVTGRVRGAVADLGDALGDAWGVAREHGGGTLRVAERALASRPYVAVGIAAALVVVAGVVASRALVAHRPEPHDDADGWDHFV